MSDRQVSDAFSGLPEPNAFARAWAEDWNSHDLDRILARYARDVVFSSPYAKQIVPTSGGILRGVDELRQYWAIGLESDPALRFEVLDAYAGVDTLVIRYRNQRDELKAEVLTFRNGMIIQGAGLFLASL